MRRIATSISAIMTTSRLAAILAFSTSNIAITIASLGAQLVEVEKRWRTLSLICCFNSRESDLVVSLGSVGFATHFPAMSVLPPAVNTLQILPSDQSLQGDHLGSETSLQSPVRDSLTLGKRITDNKSPTLSASLDVLGH